MFGSAFSRRTPCYNLSRTYRSPVKFYASAAALLLLATARAATPAPAPLKPLPAHCQFKKAQLGNVTRVIGARLHAPITITANASAPITADFSGMDPRVALAAAA